MTLIAGADIAVLADTGAVPFLLDVHELDRPESVLTPLEDALEDLACEVKSAQWSWGISEWAGPLSIAEAGQCELVLADPERTYDPSNPSGVPLSVGAAVRVVVDGAPAWSGFLGTVVHDHAAQESKLKAGDAIGVLVKAAIDGLTPAGDSFAIMAAILAEIAWPSGLVATYGSPTAYRDAGTDPEQAWEALVRNARAELGTVWIDRRGGVAMRGRGSTPLEVDPVLIGCEGADLADLESELDRAGLTTHVLVEGDDTHPVVEWSDPVAVGAYGRRSERGRRDELRLSFPP